jgi:hypothetical protein
MKQAITLEMLGAMKVNCSWFIDKGTGDFSGSLVTSEGGEYALLPWSVWEKIKERVKAEDFEDGGDVVE